MARTALAIVERLQEELVDHRAYFAARADILRWPGRS
jgi:predicted RNA polymerase sigma factor